MDFGTITAVIASLGGFEAVKWGITAWANRHSDRRHAEAEADSADFSVLRDTTVFLQEQLRDKEVRFAEQTAVVRQLNQQVFDLTRENGELKVQLERERCEDLPCPFRRPPNAYTPPPGKTSREAYVQSTRPEYSPQKTVPKT